MTLLILFPPKNKQQKNKTLNISNMKTYQLTEQQLFNLLRNSFIAGEYFAEDVEVTEKDFDEFFEDLDLTDYIV